MAEISQLTRVLGIIPARWASTRFPGKPLHLIGGKPLVQHVWDQCAKCRHLERVVVATDDERIADAVRNFGGQLAMTRADHPSGTDRVAEVALQMPEMTHVINIQGDEPLICPDLIDQMATQMTDDPALPMVTAANPLDPSAPEVQDPNVVKVTIDNQGRALYFSRSPIPFVRCQVKGLTCYRHKGIYGYRREFLLKFVDWQPSLLEQAEGLEQLRAMENGARIQVILTDDDSPGIDTLEQASILDREFSK